jgi:hypothetical protein
MKFFTPQWATAKDAPDGVFKDYERHFRGIRAFLPDEVVAFEAAHTLHDARLLRVRTDEHAGTIVLEFEGWDAAFAEKKALVLRFGGVRVHSRRQHDGADPLAREADLHCWEWDWTGDAVELRLLYCNLAEVRVVATRFAFEVAARA